jgi:hypothetical protein
VRLSKVVVACVARPAAGCRAGLPRT